MPFDPISQPWPANRAVLVVHGIGDASTGADGAFPLDALRDALGEDAEQIAFYPFNYDRINDWVSAKIDCEAVLARLRDAIAPKFGNDDTARTIAEYAGDVLWPVMSLNLRFAVRDAFMAQLAQIIIDRNEAALARGDDPLDYQVSIIAHSLGCFHTYEGLWAAATEPAYALQPLSDRVVFHSVTLMASPVQLIRTIAREISALIPDAGSLATLTRELTVPFEEKRGHTARCTDRFIAITGDRDPVGGYLLGQRQAWAYMALDGGTNIIEDQRLLDIDSRETLALALHAGIDAKREHTPIRQAARDTARDALMGSLQNPHSWSAYITRQTPVLREVLCG